MTVTFEIRYFDNPYGVYYTGQVVKGQAIIHLNEPTSAKAIRITVRGLARVSFDDGDDSYSSDEKYFEETIACMENNEETVLEVGTYTYNFECLIPAGCPSSFEGTYGRIRYDTKVTIVRSLLFNKSHSAGFNVLEIYDLNRFPQLLYASSNELIKNFCCGPCSSRPLILTGKIQRSGFVPGEFVSVKAKLSNHSSNEIYQIRISINLLIVNSVKNSKTVKRQKLPIVKKKYNVPSQRLTEISDGIQIPPTSPSSQGNCNIVNISYEVEIAAKVHGAHVSPLLSIPITIGNIPFSESSNNVNSENNWTIDVTRTVPKTPDTPPSPDCPITYEEAMFMQSLTPMAGKRKEGEGAHVEKFVPRYLFYHNIPSISSSNIENR